MKVREIRKHFIERADWVDAEKTVDRVIVGDPDLDVDRCLVVWMPSLDALQEASNRGLHLVICHEPTFWTHRDLQPEDDSVLQEKKKFIIDHGITILRNHDCWDRWPGIGIPFAWAHALGIEGEPARQSPSRYLHRYDIPALPLDAFAARVAERCRTLGEPIVQVVGDGSRPVSRIGIGTGAVCRPEEFIGLGCDCSVVCDDGNRYWEALQKAREMDHPIIRVNHGTSEEPGMVTLTRYIHENIDGLTAEHLPQGCCFRLVHAS